MPDLRGHGDSAKPHDAAAYPPDVLADDGFALIEHLGLAEYDLGGYSLGGRTTLRMLARGAVPGRAIAAGNGLEGIVHTAGRGAHFRRILTNLGTFERGSAEWMAEAFLKTVGGDPGALLLVLDTFVDTPLATLAQIKNTNTRVGGRRGQRQRLRRDVGEGPGRWPLRRGARQPHERGHQAGARHGDRGLSGDRRHELTLYLNLTRARERRGCESIIRNGHANGKGPAFATCSILRSPKNAPQPCRSHSNKWRCIRSCSPYLCT